MSRRALYLLESIHAPVAQLDRAPDFESVGRGFDSLRARLLPKRRKYRKFAIDTLIVNRPE
jgi:hypothetical protein